MPPSNIFTMKSKDSLLLDFFMLLVEEEHDKVYKAQCHAQNVFVQSQKRIQSEVEQLRLLLRSESKQESFRAAVHDFNQKIEEEKAYSNTNAQGENLPRNQDGERTISSSTLQLPSTSPQTSTLWCSAPVTSNPNPVVIATPGNNRRMSSGDNSGMHSRVDKVDLLAVIGDQHRNLLLALGAAPEDYELASAWQRDGDHSEKVSKRSIEQGARRESVPDIQSQKMHAVRALPRGRPSQTHISIVPVESARGDASQSRGGTWEREAIPAGDIRKSRSAGELADNNSSAASGAPTSSTHLTPRSPRRSSSAVQRNMESGLKKEGAGSGTGGNGGIGGGGAGGDDMDDGSDMSISAPGGGIGRTAIRTCACVYPYARTG